MSFVKIPPKPGFESPDMPVVIEARPISPITEIRRLWDYRELLIVLTIREIKVRYKQTALGVLWVIIQPVFMMVFLTLIFGGIAAMPSDGAPYPIFVYTGLLPWIFFSNAVTSSTNSLVSNSSLITKVYFPRSIIPIAAVCAGLIDFIIAFGVLIVLMFFYRIGFSLNLLLLPALAFLTALAAVGSGLWMSALNVKYRDIRYALPFVMQIWLFATPIIYPLTMLPEKWRWLFKLNFLTGIIDAYRSAILGTRFDFASLGISTLIVLIILIFAMYNFRRMERTFADLV